MFLHYLTLHKNWNATLTSCSIDTWVRIPQGIINEAIDQWQTRLRACLKAKGRHFEHLLWSSHTTGFFQSHFKHTKTGFFPSHSHYCDEDNIKFFVFCAMSCHNSPVRKWLQIFSRCFFTTEPDHCRQWRTMQTLGIDSEKKSPVYAQVRNVTDRQTDRQTEK